MIRSTLALSSLLLVGLLASPLAIGQVEPRQGPPPPDLAGQVNRVVEVLGTTTSGDPTVIADAQQIFGQRQDSGRRTLQAWFTKQTDALESNFGLSLSDADDTLRSQLEIPAGEGVVVVAVKPGSLAEHAGLKGNDVLLSLGEQKAKSSGQVKQILLGLGKEALEVKLIRAGKPSRMSLVGPEHGFPPDAAELWIGTPVSPVDGTLREHLPALPAETGLIVNDVVKGSPADQVSVHKDDILVAMDGKPLKNTDALIAQIQASQGKPVPLQVLRGGQPLTITITPAKRAHPTVISVRPNADHQLLYRLVQPDKSIQVEPAPREARAGNAMAGVAGNTGGQAGFSANNFTLVPLPAPQAYSLNPPPVAYYLGAKADSPTERIEAQLKEVMAKLEEISKSLEALKKAAGK